MKPSEKRPSIDIFNQKCAQLGFYEKDQEEEGGKKRASRCGSIETRLWILYTLLPSIGGIYAFVLLFYSCINYDPTGGPTDHPVGLFYSVMGTWLAGFILLILKSSIFIPYKTCCTIEHRDAHKILHWVIYLSYASILFSYELYAYTLSGWAVISTLIFWLIYPLLYLTVFLQGHVRPCPGFVTGEGEGKTYGRLCNKVLFGFTLIVHGGLLVVSVSLNYQLTSMWRTAKQCGGGGTCECL